MTPLLDAFPRRAFKLKPGRGAARGWLVALGGTLLFGAFIAMVAIDVVPAIRDDFAVRDRAVSAPAARIAEGRCRSRLFLFQSCNLTIAWTDKDGAHTRKLDYTFVEPHMGSWSAVPMMDPARPGLVTTDLGLDRMWNRVATAAGSLFVGLLLIGGLLASAWRGQAKAGEAKALAGRELAAVPVLFRGWGRGPSWIVADEHGQVFEWPVRKSDKPLVIDAARGLVLALRERSGGPAFPLDDKLRFVTLTPEERARIEAARWSRG
ncbi:hypothetical protein [Roseomonas rosulenta]|uniref:hypothetical protein n=1 Tax=Roseomonas rosulenta TaxID=2748667 RepID=UPI0018DFD7CB|nr:hypothetical protein [Roseomonas rosulenta]